VIFLAKINIKNSAGESISVEPTRDGYAKAERFIRDSEERGYSTSGDTARVADYRSGDSHWWN
jgi:hypothetical protein